MHSEASADSRCRHKLCHELRLLLLELSKLVGDYKEVWHWLLRLTCSEFLRVLVYVVYTIPIKYILTPLELTLDRCERSHALRPVKVRNCSEQMWQFPKQVCHSSALIVYEQEPHIVRMEVACQRQYVRLQYLRLSGARRTRDKSVRSMCLLV